MSKLLEVSNLSVSFGAKEVVHGIDFSISPGEKLALVGESGSGKTVTALTLLRLAAGAKAAFSRRSRASSTPPWLAASISMTSTVPAPPRASATHEPHTPHGVGVGPCSQFRQRARMRALVVLPQPRGPLNRYAWLTRSVRSACISGSVTCSCPMTSANVSGRYRRYRAVDTRRH